MSQLDCTYLVLKTAFFFLFFFLTNFINKTNVLFAGLLRERRSRYITKHVDSGE